MAERKYTRQTTRTYPDPEGSGGYGVEVTAWTDEAWNRALELARRYQADLEWLRLHPYLAGIRNFGGNVLSGVGNFINDEIFLNRGNIRVRNAQRHPEVMNQLLEAGNFTGGLVAAPFVLGIAAETAPIWGPWALRGMKALATPTKGVLAAEGAGTLAMTSREWVPWLLGGTGAVSSIPAAQYLSENAPSFSLPNLRVLASLSAPTDSTTTAPAAPRDTTSTSQSPSPAPTPEPDGDNNGNRKWYEKLWETSGEGSRRWGPKVGRFVRNWGIRVPAYTGIAAPAIDVVGNVISAGLEPDSVQHEWQWKATNMRFMPERTLFRGVGKMYRTPPANPAAPRDTTANNSAPRDTVPAVSNQQLPDSVVTNVNNDWEEWLRTRQTE